MSRYEGYGARIGTFLLAMLFLFTAIGFSAAVIWQIRQEDKQRQAQQALTEATDQTNPATDTPKEGELQGTKLKDFTPSADPVTTLQKIDTVPGTGAEAKAGDTITAHYTGALVRDGTIFQSSHDSGQTFTSPLSGLIKGWQEGIPGMKEGGTRRLIIPAAQAYGEASQSGIPANSDLVFDIELVKVGE
jgi:peptidylprolyl isomerase